MTELERAALEAARGKEPTPKAIMTLTAEVGENLARWAFLQHTLRQAATRKFERASEMLFDRDGLEMATSPAIAAYHASLFPSQATVVDLTAGLGSDVIALARRGPTLAYELDPERARLAAHNLAVHGVAADLRVGDGLQHHSAEFVFADPARRDARRRSRDMDAYVPPPAEILARHVDARLVALKLSPLIADDEFVKLATGRPFRLEFLSLHGDCPEALFVLGGDVTESWRGAVRLDGDTPELLPESTLWDAADEAREFLFEADPAAIRAHALGGFGLAGLGDSNGYLTGAEPQTSTWLRGFRVLEDGAFDVRRVRQELVRLDARTPEVKLRGVREDPARLRREWRMAGSRGLEVVLYPVGKRIRAAIVERL